MDPFTLTCIACFYAGKTMGKKFAEDLIRADDYAQVANEFYEQKVNMLITANESLQEAQQEMAEALKRLGKRKKDVLFGSINEFTQIMTTLGKKLKLNHDTQGLKELESFGFSETMFKEVQENSAKWLKLSANLEETEVANYLFPIAFGALGATTALGLSVALPISPLVLLYSSSKADEAETEFYRARQKLEEAKVHFESCSNQNALMRAITFRARQIDNLLEGLNSYFERSVARVKEIVREDGYNYRSYGHEKQNQIFIALQIVQTVKAVIDSSMFFEDGRFNSDSYPELETGEKMLNLLRSN